MENPADIIRDRLRRLGASAAATAKELESIEQPMLEAEVVEERRPDDEEEGDGAMVPA
jgi:hypothetical protein